MPRPRKERNYDAELSNRNVPCTYCVHPDGTAMTFRARDMLEHYVRAHNIQTGSFVCANCGFVCPKGGRCVSNHITRTHNFGPDVYYTYTPLITEFGIRRDDMDCSSHCINETAQEERRRSEAKKVKAREKAEATRAAKIAEARQAAEIAHANQAAQAAEVERSRLRKLSADAFPEADTDDSNHSNVEVVTLVGDQETVAFERMPATAERGFPGSVRNTYSARKKRKTDEHEAVARNLSFNFPANAQSSSSLDSPATARVETRNVEADVSSFRDDVTQAIASVAPQAIVNTTEEPTENNADEDDIDEEENLSDHNADYEDNANDEEMNEPAAENEVIAPVVTETANVVAPVEQEENTINQNLRLMRSNARQQSATRREIPGPSNSVNRRENPGPSNSNNRSANTAPVNQNRVREQ